VHHRILDVDYLVDVGHEVVDGMCVNFMDHLK
jgi:hypothetical protein